jgi:choloylglycine hydrolase
MINRNIIFAMLPTKQKLFMTLLLITTIVNLNNANACTTLTIKDNQGNIYQGRTMEFGDGLPKVYLNYYPKGSKFKANAPVGSSPLNYDAKYAFIAATGIADKSNQLLVADGINTQGLTVALNMFGQSKGSSTTARTDILDADSLGKWILSQFATTKEAAKAISQQPIWFEPTVFGKPFPFHIAVFDRSGSGIVLEFIEGKLTISDNPVGVMTNGPYFKWHLTNLNNYTTLSNIGNSTSIWNGYHIAFVDIGGNTLGLPSDDSSSGRFVRAVFYTNYAVKPDQSNATAVLGKIMNKFDRVNGVTRTNGKSSESLSSRDTINKSPSEWTIFTTLRDLNNNIYYIRTENSINYSKFDLNLIAQKSQPFSIPFNDLDKPESIKLINND